MPPAIPTFPLQYLLPVAPSPSLPAFPTLATPHGGRQSFPLSDLERKQYTQTGRGRPQFKQRHSGSVLLSIRQQELQQPSWFETNYTILRSLGNGAFSDAFEVTDRQRGGVYAVKRTKHPFAGPKDR